MLRPLSSVRLTHGEKVLHMAKLHGERTGRSKGKGRGKKIIALLVVLSVLSSHY